MPLPYPDKPAPKSLPFLIDLRNSQEKQPIPSISLAWVPSLLWDEHITFPRWNWSPFFQRQNSKSAKCIRSKPRRTPSLSFLLWCYEVWGTSALTWAALSQGGQGDTRANSVFSPTILQANCEHFGIHKSLFCLTLYESFFHFSHKSPCFQTA